MLVTEILAASSRMASQSDDFIQTLRQGSAEGKEPAHDPIPKKNVYNFPNTNLKHNIAQCNHHVTY